MQSDLNALYHCADDNNMTFNSCKFEALRYGKDAELMSNSSYKSYDGSVIVVKNNLRDLGVIMEDNDGFASQVQASAKAARNKAGWVLRVFSTRAAKPMLILF